jgi:hypothetical protein
MKTILTIFEGMIIPHSHKKLYTKEPGSNSANSQYSHSILTVGERENHQ